MSILLCETAVLSPCTLHTPSHGLAPHSPRSSPPVFLLNLIFFSSFPHFPLSPLVFFLFTHSSLRESALSPQRCTHSSSRCSSFSSFSSSCPPSKPHFLHSSIPHFSLSPHPISPFAHSLLLTPIFIHHSPSNLSLHTPTPATPSLALQRDRGALLVAPRGCDWHRNMALLRDEKCMNVI